jgi:hypothetical protein
VGRTFSSSHDSAIDNESEGSDFWVAHDQQVSPDAVKSPLHMTEILSKTWLIIVFIRKNTNTLMGEKHQCRTTGKKLTRD